MARASLPFVGLPLPIGRAPWLSSHRRGVAPPALVSACRRLRAAIVERVSLRRREATSKPLFSVASFSAQPKAMPLSLRRLPIAPSSRS